MIAALYVATDGVYYNLPNVDPWDINRDARKYDGPYAVVAHPPCERWGNYWYGGPSARVRRKLGDDNGCFEAALVSVRKFGGVLEHPANSHAFRVFGLGKPSGAWTESPDGIGWICCVEQGNYGHPAKKRTWLYAVGAKPQGLVWGVSSVGKPDDGYFSDFERARGRRNNGVIERLSKRQRAATPRPFRDVLIAIAEQMQCK